jgi:hypothetical protein
MAGRKVRQIKSDRQKSNKFGRWPCHKKYIEYYFFAVHNLNIKQKFFVVNSFFKKSSNYSAKQ